MQRAESEFDPVPFDAEAARIFGSALLALMILVVIERSFLATWHEVGSSLGRPRTIVSEASTFRAASKCCQASMLN